MPTLCTRTLPVLLGAVLLMACSHAPVRPAGPTAAQQLDVVAAARAQLGVAYRYGGADPSTGFDCSGLVYWAHRRAGVAVPRTAGEQFKHTRPVKRRDLRPGDLVFFRTGRRFVGHVGIYLGQGRFLHAPSSGGRVHVAPLDGSYWEARYLRGGRFPAPEDGALQAFR